MLPPEEWDKWEGAKRSDRFYGIRLVVGMLMLQRLDPLGTQQEVVNKLTTGQLDCLQPESAGNHGKMSSNTGGYARACGRLSVKGMEEITDRLLGELGQRIEPVPEWDCPIMIWDGTTVSLEHTASVLQQYPPARNQYGKAHWGMMLVVAFHDVRTGLALRPRWGPMYGPEAVSEQQLAVQTLEQAPKRCVVLGDGNFGIFYLAYQVDQSQRGLIFRLTPTRAKSMGAGALLPYGERTVIWKPTRKDRNRHPDLPEDAQIEGRLIAVQPNGSRDPWYLFTTQSEELEKIVSCYHLRWNIEGDLRSLKHTLNLHHLRARSVEAIEKELLIATVSYGMVRAFMAVAARRVGVSPRRLSFTRAWGLTEGMIGTLCSRNREKREQGWDLLLYYIAQAKLPNRAKSRCYPRAVWGFRQSFPPRKLEGPG